MVDSISKANMYELEDILVCVKPDSKNVKDEEVLIDLAPSDKMTNWNCNGNSCAADDILFHLKSEADSEFVVNEKMQNVVSDLIDVFPKQSCSAEDAFVVLSESVTNSDLKYTNDEIVQKEDLNRFCMPIDPKNAEAIAVIEADVNCKDLESMERNNSTAESNQVCDISKISSGSKGAISKNKQDVYVPLAQQVAAFQQKCPERYLSSHVRNFQSTKNWAPPKYVPKSPKLQAAKRHREIKTSVEDVKRYEFHARPFNPKIFEKPMTLEIEKQSTQPKSFTLKTAQRAEAHVKNENLDVKKREFHARPVPKSCHMKQNEPEKVKIHTTKPKSPNFALKNREEKWSQRTNKTNDDTKQSNQKVCSKQPKPADFSESVLKHEKKPIEVVPFSFEEREKARMALKQQRSQDLGKENLKPGFKAREMPSFKPPALPSIQRKPATQPEPFTFLSESRISSQKGDTTISDKTSFKPHPDNVLKTFNSKKVLSITEVKEFQLHTEKRAKEWKQLEEIRKTEEMEKQQALEAYKVAKESQEQREIMKMRQNAVHKANPIRAYKNVEIKPCNLVTQPFTPKFETDKRLQLRHDKTGLDKTEIDF
ncbi:targeting protein for Xklp2-like [Uloborus diversus]|uniref:targeting protein for Xklp2-like n=1 Tax=Uloborus diversus TaxID=327109 RepID=UPI002409E4AD|nr:targeting protein for Xklp2-like [Uloborus diversus]